MTSSLRPAGSTTSTPRSTAVAGLAAALAIALALAGCAGTELVAGPDSTSSGTSEPSGPHVSTAPDGPDPGGAPGPAAPTEPYALLRAPGWELDRALDPGPDDAMGAPEPAPVEWFAEYERSTIGDPSADSGFTGSGLIVEAVRVSGHLATIDVFREAYERVGFVFRPAPLGDRTALVATGTSTEPAIVVVEMGPGTVMLLSYGVGTAQLVELARDLAPADAAAWLAVGGEIW